MKKHRVAFAFALAALVALASASSWEGSAMMGSYGDFPSSGYYAACNSFSRNTSVEVVNLENGRSITVIVTTGLESSGVFMMLSVEAAEALGLRSGMVARIRASEPRSAVELAPSASAKGSYDPDMNPRLLAAQELKKLGYDLEPTGTAAFVTRPAVSSAREAPAPAAAAKPVTAEPVVPAAAVPLAPTAPAIAATSPVTAPSPALVPTPSAVPKPAAPSALGIVAPPAALPRAEAVAVAEPAPVGKESPEPLASAKPKPVRTIVLPQLPEPAEPVAKISPPLAVAPLAAAPAVEAKPEVISIALPEPDETPLRVAAPIAPKRYEAPAIRPDVSVAGLKAPAQPAISVALADPAPVSDARAIAVERTVPFSYPGAVSAELYDPATPAAEGATALSRQSPAYIGPEGNYDLSDPSILEFARAEAIARNAPERSDKAPRLELAWPELEADEIPEIILAELYAPAGQIPATSLAEGEIIVPGNEGLSALALETPAYGAAETFVALEDAEAEPVETPSVETAAGIGPYPSGESFDLAEAEAKPGETPLVVTQAGLSPYYEEGEHVLAEAEALPGETPKAEALASTAPVDSGAKTALVEAAEQKPETAPYVGSPAEKPAPVVALDSPKEYIVAIEPAAPKPPVVAPQPVPKAAEAPAAKAPAAKAPVAAPAAVPAIKPMTSAPPVAIGLLEKGRYYIQIGAFGSESAARDNAAKLGAGYAVLAQKTSDKGKDTWRVYVGPLSRDESGLALVRVRAMGYKDAFVKSGS